MSKRSGRRTGWTLAAGLVLAAGLAWAVFDSFAPSAGRADPNDARLVALGERVYADACAACHGAGLEGQPDWRRRLPSGRLPAPPHDATGHTWHHPDAQLFRMTKEGIAALAPPGYETDMRGFGGELTDEEIWAVLAYIKSTWPPEILDRQQAISARAAGR